MGRIRLTFTTTYVHFSIWHSADFFMLVKSGRSTSYLNDFLDYEFYVQQRARTGEERVSMRDGNGSHGRARPCTNDFACWVKGRDITCVVWFAGCKNRALKMLFSCQSHLLDDVKRDISDTREQSAECGSGNVELDVRAALAIRGAIMPEHCLTIADRRRARGRTIGHWRLNLRAQTVLCGRSGSAQITAMQKYTATVQSSLYCCYRIGGGGIRCF